MIPVVMNAQFFFHMRVHFTSTATTPSQGKHWNPRTKEGTVFKDENSETSALLMQSFPGNKYDRSSTCHSGAKASERQP